AIGVNLATSQQRRKGVRSDAAVNVGQLRNSEAALVMPSKMFNNGSVPLDGIGPKLTVAERSAPRIWAGYVSVPGGAVDVHLVVPGDVESLEVQAHCLSAR